MINQSIIALLKRLWRHISLRRRRQFALLLLLMLFASFAEILSIGAVLPFLAVLTAPERIFELPIAQPAILALNFSEPKQLLFPITCIFVLAALFAGCIRLLLLWSSTRLSFATGADLSITIYRRTLYQPYTVHCTRNSSEVIDGISRKTSGAINIIANILSLISSAVMLITILIAMVAVNPLIAIASFGGFGLIYIIIIGLTRSRLSINSQITARESTQVIKCLQEGLGGIRDVLIDGSQPVYCQIYRDADFPLRRAQCSSVFIGASPRYAMEALGMGLIAALAYSLAQQVDGISKAIPILGALALGAQRLLPSLQLAYSAWANIQGSKASLSDTLELLDQPMPSYANQKAVQTIAFNCCINLSQLSFRYSPQTPYVLNNVNLNIAKGSRVGIVGTTGSGKSTLLDIVMGLLQPTNGKLEVDGKDITLQNIHSWQAHIAHVPQAIFLADSSIEENIAFGIPKDKIDHDRVRNAAQQAQIASTIESLPQQYKTFVGERGIRLSGGQRQRIGIARALYKQADVIVFDEATSALDGETEFAVMKAIDELGKDLTLIIIAHRISTLKNCTKIVELSNGEIKREGSYIDIVKQSNL
jgi:ABC-type bacteriocin/lantibiotic exporter with double-glycine peptidase domain